MSSGSGVSKKTWIISGIVALIVVVVIVSVVATADNGSKKKSDFKLSAGPRLNFTVDGYSVQVTKAEPERNKKLITTPQPAVVLLHGFPEGWSAWLELLPVLYGTFDENSPFNFDHVYMPDMRGYNLSDKPRQAYKYEASYLISDVVLIIENLPAEERPVHLVGHDIGGMIAYSVAAQRPDLIKSLVVMNAPHPDAYFQLLRDDTDQQDDSDYILEFIKPNSAELIKANNFAAYSDFLNSYDWYTDNREAEYEASWSLPGDPVDCMMDFYRANFIPIAPDTMVNISTPWPTGNFITVPHMVLWGIEDFFYTWSELKNASLPFLPADTEYIEVDCDHYEIAHDDSRESGAEMFRLYNELAAPARRSL
eukprot:TRINITY_DN4725_c0_g1_i1.p2 TRINITY_DN4725_c0_g1~~TRINITY_DN4725_c0_g1_i1.p2  ORF type:complete len:413 (-),score=94.52 TRINITY_DN4725_c0_g1_i1:46-1143(-)